jgi:hypothetical protein
MTEQRNALKVRQAIEAAHPEVTITTPLTSRSGNWELSVGGESTQYSNFWMMVDHLAAKFGDIEPTAIEPATDGRYVEYGIERERS